jgi:hypothetical protein
MNPQILGVFAFLDAIPEDSIPTDRIYASIYRDSPEELRKKKLAGFINTLFRLQWRECPLRPLLAGYRLYFRDDMAMALAHAYILQKDGKDPEEALTADYCPGFMGLLQDLNIDEYRNSESDTWQRRWWNQFAGFHEDGDRFIKYDHRSSNGYLLFRGDRLVWRMEDCRFLLTGSSLRWNTDQEKFIALGNTKGFLNGDFTWPPADWVNPVTDEQQKAYDEEVNANFKNQMRKLKEDREKSEAAKP